MPNILNIRQHAQRHAPQRTQQRTQQRALRLDFSHGLAILMAFFTFFAAAVISRNTFERLPHLEDEFAYLYQAQIFARGYAFVTRTPGDPASVFWRPFIIEAPQPVNGVIPRFGKYTPGYPLLLAPGVMLGTPWVINAMSAMLSVAIIYRLGRRLFGRAAGLTAAVLLACSPLALLLNGSLMSHSAAMFLAALFIWCFVEIVIWLSKGYASQTSRKSMSQRWLWIWSAVGGLALGMLITTRPLSGAAIASIPAVVGIVLFGLAIRRRRQIRATLGIFALMAVFTLPTLALWPLYNTIWTGNPTTNTYTLLWSWDKIGFGTGAGGNTDSGHTVQNAFRNLRDDLMMHWRDLFGITLSEPVRDFLSTNLRYGWGIGLAWVLILIGLISRRGNRWTWFIGAVNLSLIVAQMTYFVSGSSSRYSTRYYYEVTFASCLLGGIGLVALWRWMFGLHRTSRTSPRSRRAALIGVIALLVTGGSSALMYTPARLAEPVGGSPTGLFGLFGVTRTQLVRLNNFRRLSPDRRPILLVQIQIPYKIPTDWWQNYSAMLAVTSPFLDSDIVVARILDPAQVPQYAARYTDRRMVFQVAGAFYNTLEDALRAPIPDLDPITEPTP